MALWRKLLIGSLGGAAAIAASLTGAGNLERASSPPVDVARIGSEGGLVREHGRLRPFATREGPWRVESTAGQCGS